jgi:hypothetical protein
LNRIDMVSEAKKLALITINSSIKSMILY